MIDSWYSSDDCHGARGGAWGPGWGVGPGLEGAKALHVSEKCFLMLVGYDIKGPIHVIILIN